MRQNGYDHAGNNSQEEAQVVECVRKTQYATANVCGNKRQACLEYSHFASSDLIAGQFTQWLHFLKVYLEFLLLGPIAGQLITMLLVAVVKRHLSGVGHDKEGVSIFFVRKN